MRRHHAGVSGRPHPLLSRAARLPRAGQGRARRPPPRRPDRRLDARGAQGGAGRRGPLLRRAAVRRRARQRSLHRADLAPQRAGRAWPGDQGGVRLQLSRLSAAARPAQRRGLLPRPARLRRLLAGPARRHRAGAAARRQLERHGALRLRPRTGGAPRRHLSEVRRGRSRLLRQRIRRLPGHLHQLAVREPGVGPLRPGCGGAGRLFQRFRAGRRHGQHARRGDRPVRPDPVAAGALPALHRRCGAAAQTPRQDRRHRADPAGTARGQPAAAGQGARAWPDPRLERIRRLPVPGSDPVVEAVLRQQRAGDPRLAGHRRGVDRDRRAGCASRRGAVAAARAAIDRATAQDPAPQYPPRPYPGLHRPAAGSDADLPPVAAAGEPQRAGLAAPRLRRTAAGRRAARRPRAPGHRLRARPWRHQPGRGRQHRPAHPGRARPARFHFLRLRAAAAAPGPDRGIPVVPVRAPLPRAHARQLDRGRGQRHHRRHAAVLHPGADDHPAAAALDAGVRGQRRRGAVPGARAAA